tara:strand:- start:629 stop:1852 length:1224 start_codon:yes stop_codon:yes gene_type:complete
MNNLILALMGWTANASQVVLDATLVKGKSRIATPADRGIQAFSSLVWFVAMLGAGGASGTLALFLANLLNRALFDRRPSKGYFFDKETTEEQAWSFLGQSFNVIPGFGNWIASLMDEEPMRAPMHPGSLLVGKGAVVGRYLIEAAKTGDVTYGLRNFSLGMTPMARIIDNFSEHGRGVTAFSNAQRGIQNFSPAEDVSFYVSKSVLAASQNLNPYKHELDKIQSAIARSLPRKVGDDNLSYKDRFGADGGAYELFRELVEKIKQTEPPKGTRFDQVEALAGQISEEEAWRKAAEMVSRRNPLAYARESRLTRGELDRDLSKVMKVKYPDWYNEVWGVLNNFDDFTFMSYNGIDSLYLDEMTLEQFRRSRQASIFRQEETTPRIPFTPPRLTRPQGKPKGFVAPVPRI